MDSTTKQKEEKNFNIEKENLVLKTEKKGLEKDVFKLEKKIESDEKTILSLKEELRVTIETKDQAIKNEHQIRQELSKATSENDSLKKTNANLINSLNGLADIFNEILVSFEDQLKTLEVFQRNFKGAFQLVQAKVNNFNNPPQAAEEKRENK